MPQSDPPLRPRDPESFRRDVLRRANRIRRLRRLRFTIAGTALVAAIVLLSTPLSPIDHLLSTHLASSAGSDSHHTGGTTTLPTTPPPTSGVTPTTETTPPTSSPTPPTTIPNTTPTTTRVTPTTVGPSKGPVVTPAACGRPAHAAVAPPSPATLKRDLVGTWSQCAGTSLFGGPSSTGGEAGIEILANGRWTRLAKTPGGYWTPLVGPGDSGTWTVLPAPSVAAGKVSAIVRFVAVPVSTSASGAGGPTSAGRPTSAAPHEWTVQVTIVAGPPERARFVDGKVVANYQRVIASITTTGVLAINP